MYANTAWTFMLLLTSKLSVSTQYYTLHLQCPICTELFQVISLHFLFYYYAITNWPLTLKTLSTMPGYTVNIYKKFPWNPSTKYRNIVSYKIRVNDQRMDKRTDRHQTDRQTDNHHTQRLSPPTVGGGSITIY